MMVPLLASLIWNVNFLKNGVIDFDYTLIHRSIKFFCYHGPRDNLYFKWVLFIYVLIVEGCEVSSVYVKVLVCAMSLHQFFFHC
jgi:hypothetical protein